MAVGLLELLNVMLDSFEATYGPDAARSIMVPKTARGELTRSNAFSTSGVNDRAVVPTGWYRGTPVDVALHGSDWLIAVIATRTTNSTVPALYGDTRTGRVTTTFPTLR